jgi:hypothetical protein
MVHVASPRMLCQVEAENGQVDTTGCIRPFYQNYVLGHMAILVFYPFAWAYKYDLEGWGSLTLLQFYFVFLRIESES